MKAHHFSLCYLGGDVDLVKLKAHLSEAYPGTTLEMVRGNRVANIPLVSGVMSPEGREVGYRVVCHQFDSGFGTVSFMVELDLQEQGAALVQGQQAFRGPGLAAVVPEYINRVFGTRDAGELIAEIRKPEERRRIKEGPGVDLLSVGRDNFSIGIHEFDCIWLAGGGGEEAKKAGWRDLTAGRGQLLAGDTNRFWSPQAGAELYWDMVLLLLREHSSSCYLVYARAWLGTLNLQLKQTGESLRQKNEALWSQDRDDIETMDMNFLAFNLHLRDFLLGQEHLYRRDEPPANLRLVEPAEWERLSRYRSRRALIDGVMAECKHIIGRMTMPLDFREFRLLKTGVEQLEARIMLLTVLLVIMEIFAHLLKPGHWYLKAALVLLLAAIPGSYILWERTRRRRLRRRSRELYLRNLRSRTEEEARDIDQRLAALTGTPGIEPKTRDHYLGVYQGIRARIKERTAEISAELGDR